MDTFWETEDCFGNNVVFRVSTYQEHLLGDHSEKEFIQRTTACNIAKNVVKSPDLVRKEPHGEAGARYRYEAMCCIENEPRIITVITEDRTPKDVVTVIPSKKLLRTNDKEVRVVYERITDKKIEL